MNASNYKQVDSSCTLEEEVCMDDASDAEFADILGVGDDEFVHMKNWSTVLKGMMIILCMLISLIALTNLLTSDSTALLLISLCVLGFLSLLLCFEVASRSLSRQLVVNFGFLYSLKGRVVFLCLLSTMCFQLPFFGDIAASVLVLAAVVYLFVGLRHPSHQEYLYRLHFNGGVEQDATIQLRNYDTTG